MKYDSRSCCICVQFFTGVRYKNWTHINSSNIEKYKSFFSEFSISTHDKVCYVCEESFKSNKLPNEETRMQKKKSNENLPFLNKGDSAMVEFGGALIDAKIDLVQKRLGAK